MSKYDVGLNRQAVDPLNIILDHMEPNATVLEFGCAGGRMTQYMHTQLNSKVYIVEYNQDDFEQAKVYAEDGICGDIMQFEWKSKFADIRFDYIIFADVLEHLYDPEEVLKEASGLLKENGMIWISVPNIAHNDIILGLYENEFKYTPTGILDDTHVHFFTYKSLERLYDNLDLKPIYIDCISVPMNCTEQRLGITIQDNDFMETLDKRDHGDIYQYVLGIVKKTSEKYKLIAAENKIGERIPSVFRNVFLDRGNGFDAINYMTLRALKKEKTFSEKIELSEDVIRVRFDPVEQTPCVIKNLRIFTDTTDYVDFETNADFEGDLYKFKNYDAQIIVILDRPTKWIVFEGSIEYTYDIMPTKTSELRALKENIREASSKLDRIKKEFETEKSEKEKLDKKIRELEDELKKISLQTAFKEKLSAQRKEIQDGLIGDYRQKFENQSNITSDLEQSIQKLQEERDTIFKKYIDIVNSNTWKKTEKLRKVADKIKGNRENLQLNEISLLPINDDNISQKVDKNWCYERKSTDDYVPLVSIIVPNFNHEPYLRDRLDSIFSQSYKNYEVILLDDCSTDDSRTVLLEYAELYRDKTKVAFNNENCGKVFRQWDKGLSLAKGELIWIAESDDYCEPNFLETMVPLFKYRSTILAFARSVFMQDGKKIWSTEEYLQDLSELRWDKPFTMTATDLVATGFSRKNIIPNVSSAVFRNIGKFSEQENPIWEKMRLCGDWIFYLNLIKGGCVSYTNNTTNYYRVHASSTSLNVQKSDVYYREQCEVSKFVVQNYHVNVEIFNAVLGDLKEHYKAIRHAASGEEVEQYYNIDDIKNESSSRLPNVLIGCYSMNLENENPYLVAFANELKMQGIAITFLDFQMSEEDTQAEKLLKLNIPVVKCESFDHFCQIVDRLGGEIICSAHPVVNDAISLWLNNHPDLKCRQIMVEFQKGEDIGSIDYKDLASRVMNSDAPIVCSKNEELQLIKNTIEKSGLFDKEFYRVLYFDEVKNEMDLIEHYIKTGESKNYDPSADFDTAYYKNSVAGLKESGLNALYHYIVYGKSEMRSPVSPDKQNNDMKEDICRGYSALRKKYEKVEKNFNVSTDGTLLSESVSQIKAMMSISFNVKLKILIEENDFKLEEEIKRKAVREHYPFAIEVLRNRLNSCDIEDLDTDVRTYVWDARGLTESVIFDALPYMVYCADETLNAVLLDSDVYTHGILYSTAELYDKTPFEMQISMNQCIMLESLWHKLDGTGNKISLSDIFCLSLGGKILQLYCPKTVKWECGRKTEFGKIQKKNIMISIHSLAYGGGEIMPIRLANQLKKMGQSVLVHVYDSTLDIKKVRKMINAEIPILRLNDEREMAVALEQYKIDVINTHHQTLQSFFGRVLKANPQIRKRIRHVATSHGMYNAFTEDEMSYILDGLKDTVDCWTYVADKNVEPFEQAGVYRKETFLKIPNGIETPEIHKIHRQTLNIAEDAFVFCLASRAIAEKGWRESIEAIRIARVETKKDVHLILAGDGPIYRELLENGTEEYIHLLGFIDNPCDYYAISNAMIFTSYYASESAPLSLIEALQCGVPVIASDIGDIKQMLTCENGMAGSVFELNDWMIPIDVVVTQIKQMIEDQDYYNECVKCAKIKAREFDIRTIAEKYLDAFGIQNR